MASAAEELLIGGDDGDVDECPPSSLPSRYRYVRLDVGGAAETSVDDDIRAGHSSTGKQERPVASAACVRVWGLGARGD